MASSLAAVFCSCRSRPLLLCFSVPSSHSCFLTFTGTHHICWLAHDKIKLTKSLLQLCSLLSFSLTRVLTNLNESFLRPLCSTQPSRSSVFAFRLGLFLPFSGTRTAIFPTFSFVCLSPRLLFIFLPRSRASFELALACASTAPHRVRKRKNHVRIAARFVRRL